MALGQGRPEGGVAAGTEAAGIAEVLKSERAGRLLPFKEEQIISSAESLAEEGMTADDVQSHLGDSGLFEAYAIHFAASMGKEQLPPVKRVVANQWWMDARPAPREEEAVEVSAPLGAATTAAAEVEAVDAGTSSSDLKAKGMSAIEISAMAEQLRAQGCTADEAIGLSGVVCYGKWLADRAARDLSGSEKHFTHLKGAEVRNSSFSLILTIAQEYVHL